MQCEKNVRDEMLLINVACAMKVICSEKQGFASQDGMIADNVEFRDQCPVREEDVPRKRGLYLPEDKSLPSASWSMSTAASGDQSCQKVELCHAKSGICFLEFSMTWMGFSILEVSQFELLYGLLDKFSYHASSMKYFRKGYQNEAKNHRVYRDQLNKQTHCTRSGNMDVKTERILVIKSLFLVVLLGPQATGNL